MSRRYRAVLFDLDGTLVDSYDALEQAINVALRRHDRGDLPAGMIREYVGDGVEKLLERAFGTEQVPHTAHAAFEEHYDKICSTESKLLADVEVTLHGLAGLGVAMAVCTNKPTGFSQKILESLHLAALFDGIVGPDLAGARKPDGRHVLRALASTGAAATEALFVGDMPVDVRAARNGGTDVAVVATGSSSVAQLRAAQPDYFLERFSDLLPLVRDGKAA
jgi:phosphoglycolate phosphatase